VLVLAQWGCLGLNSTINSRELMLTKSVSVLDRPLVEASHQTANIDCYYVITVDKITSCGEKPIYKLFWYIRMRYKSSLCSFLVRLDQVRIKPPQINPMLLKQEFRLATRYKPTSDILWFH
jgi:hypothetical protein